MFTSVELQPTAEVQVPMKGSAPSEYFRTQDSRDYLSNYIQ